MALNLNLPKMSSVPVVNVIHFLPALQMDVLDFGTEAILGSVVWVDSGILNAVLTKGLVLRSCIRVINGYIS